MYVIVHVIQGTESPPNALFKKNTKNHKKPKDKLQSIVIKRLSYNWLYS